MIVDAHPMLSAMNEAPFSFRLIGSRYVGKFHDGSDYDFLAILKDHHEWDSLQTWLREHGFKVQHPNQYGPDGRLYGADVWTWPGDGKHQPVDVLPVGHEEAAFRLRWLRAMKSVGDKSGLIAKGLKAEKIWPLFWDVLSKFDTSGTAP